MKRITNCGFSYFTNRESYYKVPENMVSFETIAKTLRLPKKPGDSEETVETHVYSPDEEDCLLFHYEFTGLVGKNIVQEVAITSDTWSYLDDDFHVEITNEL